MEIPLFHGDLYYILYTQILMHVFQSSSCSSHGRVTTSNLDDQGHTGSSGTTTLDAELGLSLPKVYLS